MKHELKTALERVGWEELYSRYISNLPRPNNQGECKCCSPFPDTVDNNPSFSVNIFSGFWYCWKRKAGGDFVQFLGIMEAEEFDANGFGVPDYLSTERKLLKEFGLVDTIAVGWLQQCQRALQSDPSLILGLQVFKPWELPALIDLGIGFDDNSNRFVFPIYDRKGDLINARLYMPGSGDRAAKFIWAVSGSGNFLWPSAAHSETWGILVEGEPDALTLRNYGYPGQSGTQGAASPIPEGEWYRDKIIYLLFDDDASGQVAKDECIRRLRGVTKGLYVCSVPNWNGKPKKADISDYVKYLLSEGYSRAEIVAAIQQILVTASQVETPNDVYDADPIECSFGESLKGDKLNKKIRIRARVLARSSSKFFAPTDYQIRCPGSGHAFCKKCPMSDRFSGFAHFKHDPRSLDTLKLVQVSADQQLREFIKIHGIAKNCPDPVGLALRAVNLELVVIGDCAILDPENTEVQDRMRREAYIITGSIQVEENRDYELEGMVYPHPKTQQAVFIIDRAVPIQTTIESFNLTVGQGSSVEIFRPSQGQKPLDKIIDVCLDIEGSKSLIRDRVDLHIAYRTVFHSALHFTLAGSTVPRGWIELLVVGDTRCGKSKTFIAMSELYGTGHLIDCKMQSVPGVLGTVYQSSGGEYYVMAGLLPQHDGGIVCFDEFNSRGKQNFIESLSSTRAEGIVRINKAASGEFRARVRQIWLANPGEGELMCDLPYSGVQIIPRIIRQPEDVARFDMAMTVTQNEVDRAAINSLRPLAQARYPMEETRNLLRWIWSRQASHVVFTQAAEDYLVKVSEWITDKYDASIPIVEVNDQRIRVAKVAASVAAQCFSSDENYEFLVVYPEHVEAAAQIFEMMYTKPSMAYDTYSSTIKAEREIRNPEDVWEIFENTVSPYGVRLAEILMTLDRIDSRMFSSLIPINNVYTQNIIGRLSYCNCIRPGDSGYSPVYKKTPAFVHWLKWYLAQKRV